MTTQPGARSAQLLPPPPSKKYTLFLITTATTVPSFLHHLQQSKLERLWLGSEPEFNQLGDPTKWPWSHVTLVEGDIIRRTPLGLSSPDYVELPSGCRPAQIWSFLIEAEDILPGLPTKSSEGSDARYGVLNFASFRSEEGEKCYKEHLAALGSSSRSVEMDMQIHFTGRIISTEEMFGRGSRRPAKKATITTTLTPDGINHWTNTVYGLDCNARMNMQASWDETLKEPGMDLSFFVLVSFSSEEGYAIYLKSQERGSCKGKGVLEGRIKSWQLNLPPKGQPIDPDSSKYGSSCQPYGLDFFG